MGKEKSTRNDNKERQKTAKNLQKKHIFYSQKRKHPSSIQARFYNCEQAMNNKNFLEMLTLFRESDGLFIEWIINSCGTLKQIIT